MVEIDAALRAHSFRTRLLLQIHDELLFEVPLDEVDTVKVLFPLSPSLTFAFSSIV